MLPTNESLSEKFIKRWFWLYLFAFLTGPLWYFVKIILSRDLSVDEVGILYGVLSLFTLVIAYHDLGLTESLNYFLPKCIIRKEWGKMKFTLSIVLVAQFVSSLLLWTAFYFGAAYLGEHFFRDTKAVDTIQILVMFFFGSNIAGIISTIFNAFQDTKWMKAMELVRMSSVFWMASWLWIAGNGTLESYARIWIYGMGVAILFWWTILYRKYYLPYLSGVSFSWDGAYFKVISKYAGFVFLTQNVGTVLSQIDTLLIIYLLGNTDNGYYSNYLSLIGIPFIFITPLIAFLFPVISAMEKDQADKIQYIGTFFYKYFSVIGVAIGGFFFFAGPELATILFGEKFEFSWRILQYSAPFLLFNFLIQINFQILAGIGQIKDRVKSILVGIAFNLPLNIVLIQLMKDSGLWAAGSSLAVGLSWIPLFLVSYIKLGTYRPKFDFAFFAKNFLVTMLLVLPLIAFKSEIFLANEPTRNVLVKLVAIWLFWAFVIMFSNRSDIRFFIDEIKKIRGTKK